MPYTSHMKLRDQHVNPSYYGREAVIHFTMSVEKVPYLIHAI
jgi:hypothetical protein